MSQIVIETAIAPVISQESTSALYSISAVFLATMVLVLFNTFLCQTTWKRKQKQKHKTRQLESSEDDLYRALDAFLPDFSKKSYELSQEEEVIKNAHFNDYDFNEEKVLYSTEARQLKQDKDIIANTMSSFHAVEL